MKRLAVLSLLLVIAGTVLMSRFAAAQEAGCAKADGRNWLAVQGGCMKIRSYGTADPTGPSALIVFIHGDSSSGGPVDYLFPVAAQVAAESKLPTVALLRPGYTDLDGDRSDGDNMGRIDGYTPENVDKVADALAQLKQLYHARRLVVLGHSGGAATTAIILGRHPGLVDAAMLVSCPCDITPWNVAIHRAAWTRSLLPMDYAAKVPRTTTVVMMTGDNDHWVDAAFAKAYCDLLDSQGNPATFTGVPGSDHGFQQLWPNGVHTAFDKLLLPPTT